MKLMSHKAACFLMSAFLGAGVAQGRDASDKTLNVAYASATTFTTHLWIADDNGLFAKYGIKVNLIYVEGSAAAMQALVGGSADLVFASGSAAATAAGRGADVAIVATSGPTDFLLVTVPMLTKIEDLRGKTFGVSNFAAGDYFAARRLLTKFGLDPAKDVTFVNMGVPNPSRKLALMMQGLVTATLVNPENMAEYEGKDPKPNLIAEAIQNGVYLTVGDIIALRRVLASRSEEVKSFLKAYSEAIALAKRDKVLVFKTLQRHMNIQNPALLEAIYKTRILGTLPDLPPLPSVEATQMAIDDMASSSADLSRLKTKTAADLIDAGPLKSLEKEGFFKTISSR